MTKQDHMPLPWQLSGVRLTSAPAIGKDTRLLQIGPDGDVLALVFFDMKTGRGHNDAHLIVASVNERPALLARLATYEAALREIAAYDDTGANEYLKNHGSYSAFDEPGSVMIARKALDTP